MKYTITINQAGVVEFGLADKTDFTDWAILGLLTDLEAGERSQRLGDKVWLNFKLIMNELPLAGINSKPTLSRRIAKLESLLLIEKEQTEDDRLFAKTTDFYKKVTSFKVDTRYPKVTPVTQKEHPLPESNTPLPESNTPLPESNTPLPESNTPLPESNNQQYTRTVNNNSTQEVKKTSKKEPKPKPVKFDWRTLETPSCINRTAWEKWNTEREANRKSVSEFSLLAAIEGMMKVHAAGGDVTAAMVASIGWAAFNHEWALKAQGKAPQAPQKKVIESRIADFNGNFESIKKAGSIESTCTVIQEPAQFLTH